MLGPISGPSLGCVLKLGYRRPLDDSAFLGEIQWDEISDPGDLELEGGKKGKNKRKGKKCLKSHSTEEERIPTVKSTRSGSHCKVGGRFVRSRSAVVSHQQWKQENEQKCRSADIIFQKSAKKRAEAAKMIEKEIAATSARQEKVDHKLKERIEETLFWTEEVENELGRWEEEKKTLSEIKSKLEQAHSQTSKPARLADKCLRLREERIGQDKVTDLVEESLVMELNNVKIWQMRIKTAVEQIEFQEKENHDTVRALMRDLGTKARSVSIDSSCTQLSAQHSRLLHHTGVDTVYSPASWEKSTKAMIASSRGARDNSQQLRGDIETLVRSFCADLVKNWKKTNSDLREQLDLLGHSVNSIEERQNQTVSEMGAQAREIEKLRTAIQAKSGPLKLAQTRLNMRTQKIKRTKNPAPEEESDPPQTELVSEVTNILDTLQVLNNHLRKAESLHKKLSLNKGKLDYDLSVKQNSIQIDSNLLMNREVYPLKLQGSWQKILLESLKKKDESKNTSMTGRSNQTDSTV